MPETKRPITPSTGTACAHRQCHGSRANSAGKNIRAMTEPTARRTTDVPGRDRTHAQARLPIHSGTRNAVNPIHCSSRSLINAPKGPTQLTTMPGPAPVAAGSLDVFHDGSAV